MPTGATATSGVSRGPEVVLLLSGPQLWWAYLAVLSNPLVRTFAECDRIVCTDSVETLEQRLKQNSARTKHILIFWDGIQPCSQLPPGLPELCRKHSVTALVVGADQCAQFVDVHPLYAEGLYHFDPAAIRFDAESTGRIRKAKLRNRLTPVRNILKRSGSLKEALQLAFGKRQLVFCGGYGLTPKLIDMLGRRYGTAPEPMHSHTWSTQHQPASPQEFAQHFHQDLALLHSSFQQGQLPPDFFVAAVRLLDRGYFIQQIRFAKLPLYTNQFSDHFIDVYSTPFYRQHIFLEFGSTISAANYPRLADLSYFQKQTLRVDLPHQANAIAQSIGSGAHQAQLQQKWTALAQQIAQVM